MPLRGLHPHRAGSAPGGLPAVFADRADGEAINSLIPLIKDNLDSWYISPHFCGLRLEYLCLNASVAGLLFRMCFVRLSVTLQCLKFRL